VSDRSDDARGGERRSTLERVVFVASSLVIAGIVGILLWSSATASDAPPSFRTVLADVAGSGSGFAVTVEVGNVGGRTAADVVVYAEVEDGEEPVRLEQTVDLLFAGESERVTFLVDQDPRAHAVQVGVQSHLEP